MGAFVPFVLPLRNFCQTGPLWRQCLVKALLNRRTSRLLRIRQHRFIIIKNVSFVAAECFPSPDFSSRWWHGELLQVLFFFSLSLFRSPVKLGLTATALSAVVVVALEMRRRRRRLPCVPLISFFVSCFFTYLFVIRPQLCFFCRQYYEMLYNTADELLNLVVDQGVRYTELEYINALSLLHRSQTGVGDLSTQNIRLQRLKEIICEQAAIKQASKDKKITTV